MMRFENDRKTRAEQKVLASLLQDNAQIRHCAHLVPRDFSHDAHGMIYLAIRKLISEGKAADCVSVHTVMHNYRRTRSAGEFAYLCTLNNLPVLPRHVGFYAAAMLEPVRL
ncbi:DnaB helicase-like protein [Paraburkholderia sp. BL8N3]|nr:DnaB-like helicase N-terminal domain-containing protein [Paraburkholderia sp. BL8N3]TCK37994.1 DnaB helicase-like protein [Paraburkholderia sp. BL8N3]